MYATTWGLWCNFQQLIKLLLWHSLSNLSSSPLLLLCSCFTSLRRWVLKVCPLHLHLANYEVSSADASKTCLMLLAVGATILLQTALWHSGNPFAVSVMRGITVASSYIGSLEKSYRWALQVTQMGVWRPMYQPYHQACCQPSGTSAFFDVFLTSSSL